MAELTTGIYRLVGVPFIYKMLQNLLGAESGRKRLIDEFIQPKSGDRILDLGCGSAAILGDLPLDTHYMGIDHNPKHIEEARGNFGKRGEFKAGDFTEARTFAHQSCDLVFAFGLLHHLDDSEVLDLLKLVSGFLAPEGRFLTIDPAFVDNQQFFSRFLINRDSGQNVRTKDEYLDLSISVFQDTTAYIREDLLRVPYTHCLMEHKT